jgi:alpha-glucosidase (family GH31 glycosyl hydrolase)
LANAQDSIKKIQGGFIADKVRIQLLTPTLVRLEYSPSGSFTDPATAVVVNRSWRSPRAVVKSDADWITVEGDQIVVRYQRGSGPFKDGNFGIQWMAGGKKGTWTPADSDGQNLGGISASLDGARKGRLPRHTTGILSRSGYFVLDDSMSPVWDEASKWMVPRAEGTSGSQDWYFFAYGADYKHVLKEYAKLCGEIPMIPKYTLGAWATDLNYEYLPDSRLVKDFHYNDDSVRSLVSRFRKESIPLDVLVLDFAWHLYGWRGGYDWSPIFPKPAKFLDWAREQGIKVTVNDHPGYRKESVLSDADSRAPQIKKLLNIPEPLPPGVAISLLGEWKFRTDPSGVGSIERWFAETYHDTAWTTLTVDRPWEDQGFADYDGVGWYRKWVDLPDKDYPAKLYAAFGSVDDEYDLYVNGQAVAHHSPSYGTVTVTDVAPYLRRGNKNLLALRVNDWGGGGGIVTSIALLTDVVRQEGIHFNLADKHQADVFMNVLHKPLMDQGVDFWWVDGGSGSCEMNGLNSQMWTNRVFYDFTQEQTGKRGFIFSRYGGWGSHRYPALFTGDTYAQWQVLAYEIPFTAQGGNVLMPYITHDIGGFIGRDISLDLYVRWLQFGVFSPFLRLHSAHENPEEGNARMPWRYGDKGIRLARDLFNLRYELLPYTYTMTHIAHDEALPLVRPLYLEHPGIEEAYHHPEEYYFGNEMLVAPIVDSSGIQNVYLPPGEWIDFFSGERMAGDRTVSVTRTLESMPVYVRAGSIIPRQSAMAFVDERPLDSLLIDIYGPQNGSFTLYEDDGTSLQYQKGKCSFTPISLRNLPGNRYEVSVAPTKGEYAGQVRNRSYTMRIYGKSRPTAVSLDGKTIAMAGTGKGENSWKWDTEKLITVIQVGKRDILKSFVVSIR